MKFGVHVGVGGGFAKAVQEAQAAGCDCMQIFAGNPRGWRKTPYDAGAWREFERLRAAAGIAPTVIHTSYLINLATADAELRRKSIGHVAKDLEIAARGGIEYVNTHLGSFGGGPRDKGVKNVAAIVRRLAEMAKPGPMLLLENSAGAGFLCGGTLEELGQIVKLAGSRRIGVCIDTAHAWAAGYDISNPRGVEAFVEALERHVGHERVRAIHLNDTQIALGARRDRHWHVGQGAIGERGFCLLLRRPELAHTAVICETPKTPELDRRNVAAARRLAGVRGAPGRNKKKPPR